METLFGRTQHVIENNDAMGAKYCKAKWENYISIVEAMCSALSDHATVSHSQQDEGGLSHLLDDLLTAMERELEK